MTTTTHTIMNRPFRYQSPKRGTCPSCGGYVRLHWGYVEPHRPVTKKGITLTADQKRRLNRICLRGKDVLPVELAPILLAIMNLGDAK